MEDMSISQLNVMPSARERHILEVRVNALLGYLKEEGDDRYSILEDLFNDRMTHFRIKYVLDPRQLSTIGYKSACAVFASIERRRYYDLYHFLMTVFPEESTSSSDQK